MPVTSIDTSKDFQTIINSGKVVVIDFHANWCGLSSTAAPFFADLSETYLHTGLGFYRVDVDDLEDVALEVDVRVVHANIHGL